MCVTYRTKTDKHMFIDVCVNESFGSLILSVNNQYSHILRAESVQKTPTLLLPNAMLTIRVIMYSLYCSVLFCTMSIGILKEKKTLGELIVRVSSTYLGHFIHDFHAQIVTWKGRTLQPNVYFRIIHSHWIISRRWF